MGRLAGSSATCHAAPHVTPRHVSRRAPRVRLPLGRDGLGDVMSPQDSVRLCAAKLVEFDGSPMLASKAIIHQAALHMEQGGRTSTDNITVVVIVLRDSKR